MNNDEALVKCEKIIEELLVLRQTQDELDTVYLNFLQVYYEQMANFMKEAKQAPKSSKVL